MRILHSVGVTSERSARCLRDVLWKVWGGCCIYVFWVCVPSEGWGFAGGDLLGWWLLYEGWLLGWKQRSKCI